MKKSLIALCLVLSLAVSCEKTPGAGTGISFRASLQGSDIATKTAYGPISSDSQDYQMLNWVAGDVFRVYSPQAVKIYTTNEHFADYKVDGIETQGTTSVAKGVLSADDGNGLGWQESGTHYFYSVYPSPAVNSNITIEEGTGSNAVTVTGTIPATQTLDWTTSGTSITGTPDMNYAYMYASATSTPSASVDLTFRPAFTAFQIEVSGASATTPVSVSSFRLSSTSSALCGTFTLAVNDALTPAFSGPAYSAGVNNSVSCTLGGGTPVSLTSANTLVLTVFALPLDLSDLSISFTTDTGVRTLQLSSSAGSPISFVARKKYRIHGLQLSRTGIVSAGVSITSDWGETVLTPEVVVSE